MACTDIMVDLETFGSTPGSVIVRIGAVAFDPASAELGARFLVGIDPTSAQQHGLTIDGDTVKWWLTQSDAARADITNGKAISLPHALISLTSWWTQAGGQKFWGHGGNFDDPVLAAAYRAAGMKPPWSYSRSRCTRTIFDLAGVEPERAAGVHHTALDDALAQALAVQAAYSKLGLDTASLKARADDVRLAS